MSGHRTDQVGAQVRAEIMDIIQRDLKDPRIGIVTVTGVTVYHSQLAVKRLRRQIAAEIQLSRPATRLAS